MARYIVVAVFLALIVLLGVGLTLNPREVPSPLVGKAAPYFQLGPPGWGYSRYQANAI